MQIANSDLMGFLTIFVSVGVVINKFLELVGGWITEFKGGPKELRIIEDQMTATNDILRGLLQDIRDRL